MHKLQMKTNNANQEGYNSVNLCFVNISLQAVRENDTATVKKLLSAGVDVDCLFYNWTPLMLGEQKIEKPRTPPNIF